MPKITKISQQGASMVEMLTVLVISTVIVTFAVAQYSGAKTNLQRQNIARDFKTSLERARFDSVKRHATEDTSMALVTVMNETSYSVSTDLNQNGRIDNAESQTVNFSGSSAVRLLLPPGSEAPVSISFDHRGHATIEDYNGASVDYFLFCGSGCTASNASSANSTVVYISPTGTVSAVGASEPVPSIAEPALSNVPSNFGINSDLTIWVGIPPTAEPTPSPSSSPTPAATATPSPSAYPSPTPSGYPSPTPSGLPSASPTPTAVPSPAPLPSCSLNQRPGNPATCQCMAPWFIGKNGKCAP